METRMYKIPAQADREVLLRVIPGHFATNHSHINYYIDLAMLKTRQKEAQAAARVLAQYCNYTVVDTIVCVEGCEVIGAYLAEELTNAGIMSMNRHKTIYIASPESHTDGQIIFRDNMQMMIKDKNVLLLLATATTGKTLEQNLKCIEYYGGRIQGINAIFSAVNKARSIEVKSIFTQKDIPDYHTYEFHNCPMCKNNQKVDAIVNTFGYSKIE